MVFDSNNKNNALAGEESQVGQPAIVSQQFEPPKPEVYRIEKQQYHNPDRIYRHSENP